MNCVIGRALVAMTIAYSSVLPASAQSKTEQQALKSAAWAQVIAHKCDKYEVDWRKVGLVLALAGISAEDIDPAGRRGKEFGAQIKSALDSMKNQEASVICTTGMVLYGPSGRNIPGGLQVK